MWCVPNILVLILGLILLAVLVGLARWALGKFPDKIDPFILTVAHVVMVVAVVLWVLDQFCLFANLQGGHAPLRR